jgi:hypothetical protein
MLCYSVTLTHCHTKHATCEWPNGHSFCCFVNCVCQIRVLCRALGPACALTRCTTARDSSALGHAADTCSPRGQFALSFAITVYVV